MFSFLIERSGQPEKCLAGCRNSIIFAYDGFVNTSQQFNITISHYDKPAAKGKTCVRHFGFQTGVARFIAVTVF